MSQMSTGLNRHEKRALGARSRQTTAGPQPPPLVVTPKEAARLLALSPGSLYGLMRAGELESFRDGRSRKIIMASIERYVARQLAAADGWGPWPHNPRALARLTAADRKPVAKPSKRRSRRAHAENTS